MRPYEVLPLTSSPTSGNASVLRSESLAYPQPTHKTLVARISYCVRRHSNAVLATLAFVAFLLVISSDLLHDTFPSSRGPVNFGGAMRKGYFFAHDAVIDNATFKFAAVTDLDQLSRDKDSSASKPSFRSILLSGTVKKISEMNQYSIEFDSPYRVLKTKHNEAGRGAEFSELVIYQNRLLTFDDRTGDVFEILNKPDGQDSFAVPRFVFTEGEGDTDKGMKWEWSTIKNNELYLGSMGKEYTNPDGSIANTNNLWITIINQRGEARRLNWRAKYHAVRHALNADPDGYVIHEAVNWSPILNKWVFLPRRVSDKKYDENQDERQGASKIVLVDDQFTTPTVVDIKFKQNDPLHGFSTFAFVPNSNDRHALAIRSVEEDCVDPKDTCKQRSYFTILDILTGEVLCDEVEYPEALKFEGVEFVKLDTVPPPLD